MSFEQWLAELAVQIGKVFDMDGSEYIEQTGKECWRDMFVDGMSPEDAAREEALSWCE